MTRRPVVSCPPILLFCISLFVLHLYSPPVSAIIFSMQEHVKLLLDDESDAGHFGRGNQYLAQRILHRLGALFQKHRFVVSVANSAPDMLGRSDNTEFFEHKGKSICTYYVFAVDNFQGSVNCYGDLTPWFRNDCFPMTDKIARFIGDICGKEGGFNEESVGLRGVVKEMDKEGAEDKFGLASSLPDHAFRHEQFTCQNETGRNKRWHVVIALFQNFRGSIDQLERNYVDNSSDPLMQIFDSDEVNISQPIFTLFLVAFALILFILLIFVFLAFFFWRHAPKVRGGFGMCMQGYWFLHFQKGLALELDCTAIDIENLLYAGPNSRVYQARYRLPKGGVRDVAVKVPSEEAFKLDAIIEETKINSQLRHRRIVEYIGYYRDAFQQMRIVSEFMEGGDLHSHISNKTNQLTVGHIFNFLAQIAEGMEYLASKRITHRDLAARNCMLNRECTEIKIADFGLSRHLNVDANYTATSPVRLPFRWTALECLGQNGDILPNSKFSEKSDVWSFGVVAWECFSRGEMPYGGTAETKEVARQLRSGWRLPRPAESCPEPFYNEMISVCWSELPEKRPTFAGMRQLLDQMFSSLVATDPEMLMKSVQQKH